MPSEQDENLKRIADMIYDHSSICFSPSRLVNLERRLTERRQFCGIPSLDDYADFLVGNPAELDLLIDHVSTKETYFFRIPEQFKALRELVLPRMEEEMLDRVYEDLSRGSVERVPLRIWSAGCATGQEPYSIAMTLLEQLRHPRAWRIELLATDLSQAALTTAATGFYPEEALKGVSAGYRQRFMAPAATGAACSSQLREQIEFRVFNLRELIAGGAVAHALTSLDGHREVREFGQRFDMIFCRNVMIYFDRVAQQALVDRLYDCLRPGGWLLTGDAELLHIYRHHFETVEVFGTSIYRKPGGKP